MGSQWRWTLGQIVGRLWLRAAAFGLLGVASALAAVFLRRFIPSDFQAKIGADAVDGILNILATSMLTVTTFSLSVMVSALSTATQNVTPRATRLLVQDSTTQNTLATFLGTFLFSLVGLVALSAGLYGGSGRVVLFVVTLFVVLLVIITVVRWIDYLTDFGRVGETTARVEHRAARALDERRGAPSLRGVPLTNVETQVPDAARPVRPAEVGYVQHVDVSRLQRLADEHGCEIFVLRQAGAFVHPDMAVACLSGGQDDDLVAEIGKAFTVRETRSFDQDPRFGMIVLAEIGARALSPAINDPGTAIDVIGRQVRLLLAFVQERDAPEEVRYPRVHVPPLDIADLVDDAFGPIAQFGANNPVIQTRLQKAYGALAHAAHAPLRDAVRAHARKALERGRAAGLLPSDIAALEVLAREVLATATTPLPATRA